MKTEMKLHFLSLPAALERRLASAAPTFRPSSIPFRSWGLLGALILGFCSFLCARTTHAQSPAASGAILTIAGNGNAGFSGDGGPATNATLNTPYSLVIGPDGTLTLPAGWGVLVSNYSVLSTNYVVTNAIGGTTRFYRLHKP